MYALKKIISKFQNKKKLLNKTIRRDSYGNTSISVLDHRGFYISAKNGIIKDSDLETLRCFDCYLTEISDELINLKELICSYNYLKSIPRTLTNLEILYCKHNNLETLPSSLINLEVIDCSYNRIIELPETFTKLKKLNCNYNPGIKIPIYQNLEYIDVLGCLHFKKAGINNITDYKRMLKTYNILIPIMIQVHRKKINLYFDIIFLLKKFLTFS